MYSYEQIRHVHLEPTTKCNAVCPMCARNTRGVTAPGLDLIDLSLNDFRAIFEDDFLTQLDAIDLCGSYGDPAFARDLMRIVAYIRTASPRCITTTYTNGSVRTPPWWKQFAQAAGARSWVVFAIDGLGETNAIYRRGVDFDKVIANARAFIGAGGNARWDFLVFRHNEHEVEAARALSKQLGFRGFSVKTTGRFVDSLFDYVPELEGQADLSRFPIHSKDGRVVGHLQPTNASKWTKDAAARCIGSLSKDGRLEHLFSQTTIRCRVKDSASVFVSARGYAFPCCWTYVQATRPAQSGFPITANWQLHELLAASGGFEMIDALQLGLRAAIEGPFFAAIEATWSCASMREGRLQVCGRICGREAAAEFDQFGDHKKRLPCLS